MSTDKNDPGDLADDLERQADELEDLSRQAEKHVNDVREDWERKRADPGVPGAVPAPPTESEPESGSPAVETDAPRDGES
jgi:hypothetical protein